MTWTDEELVAHSIRGDADSFNELVLRWERPIYALAYRIIGREEDARDVCQETFLRAFRACRLPGPGEVLVMAVPDRAKPVPRLDAAAAAHADRAGARRRGSDGTGGGGRTLGIDRGLVARKDLTRAGRTRDGAPAGRAANGDILKEYHGLTFQEIAELVGCPLSTVKTRLYQGLTVLRRELAKNPKPRDDVMTEICLRLSWRSRRNVGRFLYDDVGASRGAALSTRTC